MMAHSRGRDLSQSELACLACPRHSDVQKETISDYKFHGRHKAPKQPSKTETVKDKEDKIIRHCDICRKPAHSCCLQCEICLCTSCELDHTERVFHGNEPYLFKLGPDTFCQVHIHRVVKFYCHECSKAFCLVCNLSHRKEHHVLPLQRSIEYREQLKYEKDLLSQWILLIEKRQRDAEEILEAQDEVAQRARKAIADAAETVIMDVVRSTSRYLGEVDSLVNGYARQMKSQQAATPDVDHLEGLIRQIGDTSIDGTPLQCIMLYEDLKKKSADLRQKSFVNNTFPKLEEFKPAMEFVHENIFDSFIEELRYSIEEVATGWKGKVASE